MANLLNAVICASLLTIQAYGYYIDAHDNCDNVYGALQTPNNSTEWVTYLGIFSSTQECINTCLNKSISDTNRCESYTYYTSSIQTQYSRHCYGRFGAIYGIIWTPEPDQKGVMCGRIIYPCKSNIDCELNGECVITTGNCSCRAAWSGPHCQILNLLPATKGSGYEIKNDNNSGQPTSSWGGAVLIDKNDKNENTKYHMYLAEFDNHCGVNSWTINSVVTHAQSTKGYNSAYQRMEVIHSHFAHEPDAIYGSNGEVVLYYASYDYGDFVECNCEDGSTPKTCQTPDPALFIEYMQYCTFNNTSNDNINYKWSEPMVIFADRNQTILKQTDDTNLAGLILKNDTFIGMFRVGHWSSDGSEIHLVISQDWKNNDQYIINDEILFPQLVPIATEDPFLYLDCDGMYHAIFHNMSPTAQGIPGGHAYSMDGIHWIYAGSIYGNVVEYMDGTSFTFSRRERPHFIFADDDCTPIALTNGVQYGGKYGDATFTALQPIKH